MSDPRPTTGGPATPRPRAGMLLVATPALQDPTFAETVVLLLDADDDGALGVVLNRPSPVAVAEVLDAWADVVVEPEMLFRGGPVGPDGALAVALLRGDDTDDGAGDGTGEDGSEQAGPVGFREVAGPLGIVDLDTPVELLAQALAGLRIFAGYAGWGAEQLAAEIAEGSWYVVAGEPRDAFRPDPADLWREVMRRQPGELAWHSTRPADPLLN